MTEATPPPDATHDPTVATLIPEPSRRRTVALTGLAVALLAAAWFVAPLLRPTLTQSGSGVTGPFGDSPATLYQVTAAGSLTIERVTGSEGFEVAGAWVVPDDDGWPRLADEYSPSGAPEDLLHASSINPDAAALPHELADGETVWILVAWRVTGCPVGEPGSWGEITVRSRLGIERDQPLTGDRPLAPAGTADC